MTFTNDGIVGIRLESHEVLTQQMCIDALIDLQDVATGTRKDIERVINLLFFALESEAVETRLLAAAA
jgi:hypothetical protein